MVVYDEFFFVPFLIDNHYETVSDQSGVPFIHRDGVGVNQMCHVGKWESETI